MNESDSMKSIELMYEDIKLQLEKQREEFMEKRDRLDCTEQHISDLINEIKSFPNFLNRLVISL